jgi:hypothetical protein
MATVRFGGLTPLILVLMLAFVVVGCASGPLGSHGVDEIPAFETGPQGGGR